MDFSHSALKNYIKKIHLTPGDILEVRHPEVLKQLQQMPSIDFSVPVLCLPVRLECLTRELERYETNKLTPAQLDAFFVRVDEVRERIKEVMEHSQEAMARAQGIT